MPDHICRYHSCLHCPRRTEATLGHLVQLGALGAPKEDALCSPEEVDRPHVHPESWTLPVPSVNALSPGCLARLQITGWHFVYPSLKMKNRLNLRYSFSSHACLTNIIVIKSSEHISEPHGSLIP